MSVANILEFFHGKRIRCKNQILRPDVRALNPGVSLTCFTLDEVTVS